MSPTPYNVVVTGDIVKALEIVDWLDEQGWTKTVYVPIIAPLAYLGGEHGYDIAGNERYRKWFDDDRAKLASGEWSNRELNSQEPFAFEDKAMAVAFALRFDGVAPELEGETE